jgi:nicotinate-nucleotide adenylyltransferase
MRIGILGGTYDPIHNGHLHIGRQVAAQLGLAQILLIPSRTPPHRAAPLASSQQRLAMCTLAAGADPLFRVSDIELQRTGPSYTIDTLEALATPDTQLTLILGADAAALLPQWYRAADLGAHSELAVINRPGSTCDDAAITRAIPSFGGRLHMIVAPAYDISSSVIRQRCVASLPVDDLVPPPVADYIAQHGLYRSAS